MNDWLAVALFILFVLGLLALDLGVFHRRAHAVSTREAAAWSAVWVALSAAFGIGIHLWKGPESGIRFFTAYILEKSLSLDNVFLFTVIFSSLAVPPKYKHKLLFWGVLGALVLRAIFIAAGATLVSRFEWVLYVFGGFLIVAGAKMLRREREAPDPERNFFVRKLRTILPIAPQLRGAFFLRQNGRLFATPLFVALIMVEVTDVVLALDSIPAVFVVTRDPFILFTSNIFAVLGLRSLYFLLAGFIVKLRYLHVGFAAILVFVGLKMLTSYSVEVPILVSLGIICAILLATVVASIWGAQSRPALVTQASGGGRPCLPEGERLSLGSVGSEVTVKVPGTARFDTQIVTHPELLKMLSETPKDIGRIAAKN